MATDTALDELREAAIKALTAAARLRTAEGDQPDMGDFVANVVASTTANIGGPELFLSGRPGSWESDFLYRLIEGTIGPEPSRWHWFRTEPVTVPLNVAELIEATDLHRGLLGLTDAIDRACERILADVGDTTYAGEPIDQAARTLGDRYTEAYRDYGERFRAAITALAADLDLRAVQVEVDVDPESRWWEETTIHNPDPCGDPVVDDLWQRAHDITQLPDILIAPTNCTQEGRRS